MIETIIIPTDLQVTPLLTELREGNFVENLEGLTQSASLAAADIRQLQNDVSQSARDSGGLQRIIQPICP